MDNNTKMVSLLESENKLIESDALVLKSMLNYSIKMCKSHKRNKKILKAVETLGSAIIHTLNECIDQKRIINSHYTKIIEAIKKEQKERKRRAKK